jgi:hypothetical protein
MKRIATLTLVVSLFAVAAFAADNEGSWTASLDEKRPDRIYFNMNLRPMHNMGMTLRINTFTGLTTAQINAPTMTPVKFERRAEAGTLSYEGTFRNGNGAGQFTFSPNPAFIETVRGMGIDVERRKHHRKSWDQDDQLFSLAVHDVSTAFIRSMIAEGYRVSLEEYLEMRIFDITPEYIREMRSLGFKDISAKELVASKIHRVTPDFVREMRAAGWDLSLDELQSSAIHGATPKFAAEMRKLGYANLSHDDLVSFRIHRVTAEFIEELRKLGYDKIPADDLVSMRIHRVTPEFIKELEEAGYENVPVRKLVSMRIHGIDPTMIKKLR